VGPQIYGIGLVGSGDPKDGGRSRNSRSGGGGGGIGLGIKGVRRVRARAPMSTPLDSWANNCVRRPSVSGAGFHAAAIAASAFRRWRWGSGKKPNFHGPW